MDEDVVYKEVPFDEFLHDTAENIQKCLNCKKKECTNCLWDAI